MIRLLQAFGFDVVLLETAGAGQGDTAVRELADVVVLLLQPETGDELQWEKAGLLEVADVVVVHKADLPGAERVEAQVRDLLNLPGCREVPVLRASSSKGRGVEELWRTVEAASRPEGRSRARWPGLASTGPATPGRSLPTAGRSRAAGRRALEASRARRQPSGGRVGQVLDGRPGRTLTADPASRGTSSSAPNHTA